MAGKNQVASPWLSGINSAAAYAHMNVHEMRRLVKSGAVVSRMKPVYSEGSRPKGVLVYAPSIDELIMQQPSGACEMAQRLSQVS